MRHTPVLTPRQIEMLLLVASGKCDKEIMRHMGIAASTVRNQMTETFARLRNAYGIDVECRVRAVLVAGEHGLLPGWRIERE